MAIDATPAGTTSNSYGTSAEADAYFLNHPNADTWDALVEQEEMLIHATRLLDQFDYVGEPVTGTQALLWPRTLGGIHQVETATVVGAITGSGDATVIVTASGMTGSPITLNVPVLNLDDAATVATKIRTALNANTVIAAFFVVSGTGANVVLTRAAAADDDSTMNISIDNGTCTGLTPAPVSVDTRAGVSGDLIRNYSTNAIPPPIKNAQFETAMWLVHSGGVAVAAGVVSELQIGSSVRVKYAAGSSGGFVDTSVDSGGLPIQAARYLKGLRLIPVLA